MCVTNHTVNHVVCSSDKTVWHGQTYTVHDAIHICTTKYWQTRINHLRNKKFYLDKITTNMYGGKARPIGKVDTRIGLFVFSIVTCKRFAKGRLTYTVALAAGSFSLDARTETTCVSRRTGQRDYTLYTGVHSHSTNAYHYFYEKKMLCCFRYLECIFAIIHLSLTDRKSVLTQSVVQIILPLYRNNVAIA